MLSALLVITIVYELIKAYLQGQLLFITLSCCREVEGCRRIVGVGMSQGWDMFADNP